MTRHVFVEFTRIKPMPDHLPEARQQAGRLIDLALSAVSDPQRPINDRERVFLRRAIDSFRGGNFYDACHMVGEGMTDGVPAMPPANQMPDFEPLSVADLRARFEKARGQSAIR
jgi:hypothetical protein